MPDFWQFPTGSMGLGPLFAIYQARFMRYLEHRGLGQRRRRTAARCGRSWATARWTSPRRWPGSRVAARERLDNLVLVVNCNLQRLDGPVRGNGSDHPGAGGPLRGRGLERDQAAVGRRLGPALPRDTHQSLEKALPRDRGRRVPDLRGHRRRLQPRALLQQVSGAAAARRAPLRRRHRPPAPRRPRPGEDLLGVLARGAPHGAAHRHPRQDQEGLRHGHGGAGTHDDAPAEEARHRAAGRLPRPLRAAAHRRASATRASSCARRARRRRWRTCTRGARSWAATCRRAPPRAEPLATPEARGVREVRARSRRQGDVDHGGLRAHGGAAAQGPGARQAHRADHRRRGAHLRHGGPLPPDRHLLAHRPALPARGPRRSSPTTRKRSTGRSSRRASTRRARSPRGSPRRRATRRTACAMLPMYIYYSMFGFQRVGDEIWAAADSRARGFLLGATAGRTTLSGEGLQHQDGTSHLVASTIPNCRAYDPCFAYELAVILEDGMRRMLGEAGGRLLLRHGDERELRAAVDAGGRARRGSCAACTACARRRARPRCGFSARARS